MRRSRILKKAENKVETLKEILDELEERGKLSNLVIYCEDNEQLQKVKSIIGKYNQLKFGIFDGKAMEEERSSLLNAIKEGDINALLAMKCLDQGIDLPNLERAIFVSIAKSPIQQIQRLGRLLRPNVSKYERAEIYDMVIVPSEWLRANERKVADFLESHELARTEFFIKYAINSVSCQMKIEALLKQHR